MQRTILIIIGWLAVVLGTLGVVLPCCRLRRSFYWRPGVSPARRRVSMPVVIPLMVWRLSAPLAALSGHAAGSKTASDRVDIADLWYIAVAGEYDVGAGAAVGYFGLSADFYVADTGD